VLFQLTLLQVSVTVLAAIVGALAQSTLGLGFGVVLVPVLALIAPDQLPAVPLLLAPILCFAMIRRERGDIDVSGLPPLLVGRVLGTAGGIWLLIVLAGPSLEVLFGVVIVVVVLISGLRPAVQPTSPAQFLGGVVSGVFGTTAAIGGPPVAILYQGRPGPEVRSTMAVIYAIGSVLSLIGLVLARRIDRSNVLLSVALLVPTIIGFAISGPLARALEGRWLRPSILAFAGSAGVLAIFRGLNG
jgi:uncharacterized membrane protein YfcA